MLGLRIRETDWEEIDLVSCVFSSDIESPSTYLWTLYLLAQVCCFVAFNFD